MGKKFDGGKLRYGLIPPSSTRALASVLTFGAQKYGPNNWQSVEQGEERYTDALMRHLEAYRGGEDIDEESGMSHLWHAMTNIAFLIHFEDQANVVKSLMPRPVSAEKAAIIAEAVNSGRH